MSNAIHPENPTLRVRFNQLYRQFFDLAEKKRRWSLSDDIPWQQVNRSMAPAVADVVESFCAVELYLPDYIAKALPMIRANKGWAWFHANWGYEESRHSLALGDWLLRSGMRSDEQMADLEDMVFQHEWTPPHDSAHGMLVYAMVQELATWLHYRNLRQHVLTFGDPALATLLQFVAVDERAHHAFYRDMVRIFLELDRKETLEQLRRVLLDFHMPAVHLLADSGTRIEAIKQLGIFTEDLFLREVYQPILQMLGLKAADLRRKTIAVS